MGIVPEWLKKMFGNQASTTPRVPPFRIQKDFEPHARTIERRVDESIARAVQKIETEGDEAHRIRSVPDIKNLAPFNDTVFVLGDGLVYKDQDGRDHTVPARNQEYTIGREREQHLGSFSQQGDMIALVDRSGKMYFAAAEMKTGQDDSIPLARILLNNGYVGSNWEFEGPNAKSIIYGRTGGTLTPETFKPDHALHIDTHRKLGLHVLREQEFKTKVDGPIGGLLPPPLPKGTGGPSQ